MITLGDVRKAGQVAMKNRYLSLNTGDDAVGVNKKVRSIIPILAEMSDAHQLKRRKIQALVQQLGKKICEDNGMQYDNAAHELSDNIVLTADAEKIFWQVKLAITTPAAE
tara:strand:- start:706 stop:1035 length:330 start_codon:yes stop_codon:yes gene_type:complete